MVAEVRRFRTQDVMLVKTYSPHSCLSSHWGYYEVGCEIMLHPIINADLMFNADLIFRTLLRV